MKMTINSDVNNGMGRQSLVTGARESLIAVLMNLLRTRDRPGDNDELPNKQRNTAFRVTSGPGREKNSENTITNWNS